MTDKLRTGQYLEFLSLTGGCPGSLVSKNVKIATLMEITCHDSARLKATEI